MAESEVNSINVNEEQSKIVIYPLLTFDSLENITDLDLSNRNLGYKWNIKELPPHLESINLMHNKLNEVPIQVCKLKKLKILNVSNNLIQLFDCTPWFCHTIENLNISNNELIGPPYWIWSEKPKELTHLDISNNYKITWSLANGYYEVLLQHSVSLKYVNAWNCCLSEHLLLFSTMPNLLELDAGGSPLSQVRCNRFNSFPTQGLDKCCEIERLNLSNTRLFNIKHNIDIYVNLKNIDLSSNNLTVLPEAFCNLKNLEYCKLSCNSLLYLPESIDKLDKLKHLLLDYNDIYSLPEKLSEMKYLVSLDLYNNKLYEILEELSVLELDYAQNYIDEPQDEEYHKRKEKLRLKITEQRIDGPKEEETGKNDDDEPYEKSTDDDIDSDDNDLSDVESSKLIHSRLSSSSEDWDSDSYWEPSGQSKNISRPSTEEIWMGYVKRKMNEGNFCPIDLHVVPMIEQVRIQKMYSKKVTQIQPGQFDDYSGDET